MLQKKKATQKKKKKERKRKRNGQKEKKKENHREKDALPNCYRCIPSSRTKKVTDTHTNGRPHTVKIVKVISFFFLSFVIQVIFLIL